MSDYQHRHDEHQTIQLINDMGTTIESASEKTDTPETIEKLNRLRRVHTLLDTLVVRADPEFTSPKLLNQIYNNLNQLINFINQYNNSQNPAQLKQANDIADTLIMQLPAGLFAGKTLSHADYTDDIDQFRSLAAKALKRIRAEVQEISDSVGGVQSQTTQHEIEIGKLSELLAKEQKRLEEELRKTQREIASWQANTITEWSNELAGEKKKHEATRTDINSRAQDTINSANEKLEKQFGLYKITARKHCEEIEKHQAKAGKMLGVVTDTVITGQYGEFAKKEGKSATLFQWIALSLMILLAGGAIYTIWDALSAWKGSESSPAQNWQILAAIRSFTILVISIPAFYAARESSKHKELCRHYRKMQLELAAIDPFLLELDDVDKKELKKNLTERLFGMPDVPTQDKDDIVSARTILGTLENVLKTVLRR